MATRVSDVPAAQPARAEAHFQSFFEFATDCWDVHDALCGGEPDFVLLDVRSRAAHEKGHVPGAVSLPHASIADETLSSYPAGTLFVVYCAGPHCNGAHRAAVRLARLGRPVKIMIGGIVGWLDEGFELAAGRSASHLPVSSEAGDAGALRRQRPLPRRLRPPGHPGASD